MPTDAISSSAATESGVSSSEFVEKAEILSARGNSIATILFPILESRDESNHRKFKLE
jgi:hypothetical protein